MGLIAKIKTALDLGSPVDHSIESVDSTVHHCPFCGSRGVTGGSDGSISCTFCSKVFKVMDEPTHPAIPQTINGQPVGEGVDDNQPLPAAGGSPVVPEVNGSPQGIERFLVQKPQSGGGGIEKFRTAKGDLLNRDDYINHIAITHADNRDEVLMQVRSSRRV